MMVDGRQALSVYLLALLFLSSSGAVQCALGIASSLHSAPEFIIMFASECLILRASSSPMANPISIPSDSALSNNVKFATYRQEVVRILKNTVIHLPWSLKASLFTDLSYRMKVAGYNEGFRARIISEGINGYMKKMKRHIEDGIPLNRPKEMIAVAAHRLE